MRIAARALVVYCPCVPHNKQYQLLNISVRIGEELEKDKIEEHVLGLTMKMTDGETTGAYAFLPQKPHNPNTTCCHLPQTDSNKPTATKKKYNSDINRYSCLFYIFAVYTFCQSCK